MNGMAPMWDSLLEKIGADIVYDAANRYGYDTTFVESPNAVVSNDVATELFIELINFVMDELNPISPDKVQAWLDEYQVGEELLEDLLS